MDMCNADVENHGEETQVADADVDVVVDGKETHGVDVDVGVDVEEMEVDGKETQGEDVDVEEVEVADAEGGGGAPIPRRKDVRNSNQCPHMAKIEKKGLDGTSTTCSNPLDSGTLPIQYGAHRSMPRYWPTLSNLERPVLTHHFAQACWRRLRWQRRSRRLRHNATGMSQKHPRRILVHGEKEGHQEVVDYHFSHPRPRTPRSN